MFCTHIYIYIYIFISALVSQLSCIDDRRGPASISLSGISLAGNSAISTGP